MSLRKILLGVMLALALLQGCSDRAATDATNTPLTAEQRFAKNLDKARAGDASSQYDVAEAYEAGDGVSKDLLMAVDWWKKAAEQGNSNGQNKLGWAYMTGTGVDKDPKKAIELWQKSAEQGHRAAQSNLGLAYRDGVGVPKDPQKAVEWWQKAAEQGSKSAQANLALAFSLGLGVTKDSKKAVEWWQKAAEQGSVASLYALGLSYKNGDGVPKDPQRSAGYFLKAATQGDVDSQIQTALAYVLGEGVPEDPVLAYAWFNIAGVSDKIAKKQRDLSRRLLSPSELQEATRISSNWKIGQVLARESQALPGTDSPNSRGLLAKRLTGTVFAINKEGQAITNAHVVEGCTELRMQGREGLIKTVTLDAVNDLALVKLPGDIVDVAVINATPSKLRQGEEVVVFGFPLNALLSSGGNLTPGIVSALTGLGNNTNQIQITAPIQPGSSGSPVLNKKGEVVGVVSMKLSDTKMTRATGSVGQNVNFAISGLTLKTFLDTHKIEYRAGRFLSFEKSVADIADEARKWTFVVECWR